MNEFLDQIIRHKRKIRYLGRKLRAIHNDYPPFYWPTEYKVVTQSFGVNPQYYKQFGLPGHEGIDMRARTGTDIYAVWKGDVAMVYDTNPSGHAYGFHVRINHYIRRKLEDVFIIIHYQSIYAHFVKPPLVKVGEKVRRGQVIGLADSTGNSTGSHLHFSLKQYNYPDHVPDTEMQKKFLEKWAEKKFVDPTPFFRELRSGYD